jgi:hypothetical protein
METCRVIPVYWRQQRPDVFFLKAVGREMHQVIERHASAVYARTILPRSIQLAVVNKRSSGWPGRPYVGLQRIKLMLEPWAVQIIRQPGVKLRVRTIACIGGEEPPPPVMLENGRVEEASPFDQDLDHPPVLVVLVKNVKPYFSQFVGLWDAV